MNCIITGGAGFVASHLIDRIQNDYDNIYLVDNLVRTNNTRNIDHLLKNPKIKFFHGDVSTFDFSVFKNVIHFYHLAATRINRCAIYNKEGHMYIADGGFNVVNHCAKNKIKLFFSSTASVYNSPKRFPIEEEDPCVPHTIYGASKYYTEGLIRSYDKMYGMDYTINRFFCIYGDRMDNNGVYTEVIFNWLNNISKGNNEITVYGNPDEKILDLIYVSDIVDAIVTSMLNSNKQVFNVSTETGVTLTNLIDVVEKVTNTKLIRKIVPEVRNDIELKRVGSVKKLKSLGWDQKFTLEDGLKNTYKWILTL